MEKTFFLLIRDVRLKISFVLILLLEDFACRMKHKAFENFRPLFRKT